MQQRMDAEKLDLTELSKATPHCHQKIGEGFTLGTQLDFERIYRPYAIRARNGFVSTNIGGPTALDAAELKSLMHLQNTQRISRLSRRQPLGPNIVQIIVTVVRSPRNRRIQPYAHKVVPSLFQARISQEITRHLIMASLIAKVCQREASRR